MGKRSEVAVITGASAGLGRAIVREFAKRHAHLGLVSRDPGRLEAAQREVRSLGGDAIIIPTDVANSDAVEAAADATERAFGPMDIWVNNAMTSVFSPFVEMSPVEFRRVTEVTYLGTVYGTMAALRRMKPRDYGTIVQVGSALSERSIPLQSAYCGAKHGIRGFTDSIRCELLHDHSAVHMTMVQMPALNTPQFRWLRSRLPHKAQPVPPIFQPEVGAQAVYWAAHHRKRELYVGLPTVKAMIGNKLIASWLDHYLGRTGYRLQQTNEPRDPNKPDNLFETVRGDYGAHGVFDQRARPRSYQLWLDENKGWVAASSLLMGLGIVMNRSRRT